MKEEEKAPVVEWIGEVKVMAKKDPTPEKQVDMPRQMSR